MMEEMKESLNKLSKHFEMIMTVVSRVTIHCPEHLAIPIL